MRKTEEQKMAEAFADIQPTIRKQGHIKQCLHPNKAECKGEIIRAHAIQNNRILSRIAENGHVTMLDGQILSNL